MKRLMLLVSCLLISLIISVGTTTTWGQGTCSNGSCGIRAVRIAPFRYRRSAVYSSQVYSYPTPTVVVRQRTVVRPVLRGTHWAGWYYIN